MEDVRLIFIILFLALLCLFGTLICFLIIRGSKNGDINSDKEQEAFIINYRKRKVRGRNR